MSEKSTRPRQVTLAAGLIMAGSLLVVLSVFEQVAGMSSLQTREAVQDFLARPPGDGLGLGVEEVLQLMRVVAMVAGACAAAAAILGYQVLQRSRSARLALSVLAVPLFLSGLVAGGFMSSVVAAAVVMLWLQPARDWLDGVDRPAPRPDPHRSASSSDSPAAADRSTAPARTEWPPPVQAPAGDRPAGDGPDGREGPRAYDGFGAPRPDVATPYGAPHPGGPHATGPAGRPAADARPPAVVWACTLTWVFAGLAGIGMLLSGLVMAAAADPVLDEMLRQQPDLLDATGMTRDELVRAVLVVAVLVVAWCVAAVVVAFFAFRGASWARVVLLVSAVLAGLVCLFGTVAGSYVLVLPAAACAVTVFFLSRPEVGAWFRRRGSISS